ncbi:uncharacterized protein [Coffea arabica]|uniref:Uncharacterized protein isoform X1 n=1 Tax=Coffea arabica TaxID=13443 RepID=A0A6P6W984_COFAR|nr:uncharacterized protein LOC113730853 isoform X1 [Coffea arabica]
MSKKKATMTLKDFHGGSIPSDLPLPSAPGVMVRPSERGSLDRQAAWGNPLGRPDHRLRPGSAGTARNFDDKTTFLSHNSNIGRHFDEDERKPLDGVSGPRRTVSDESLRALPSHVVEPKTDYSASGRVPSRPSSTPGLQYASGITSSSYAGRFSETNHAGVGSQGFGPSGGVGVNFQNVSGSGGQMVSGPHPNAWGLRKEAAGVKEPAAATWSAPDAAAKLAHASALEKVSSGRWHSKQHNSSQPDVEVIRQSEVESEFHLRDKDVYSKNTYSSRHLVGGTDYHEAALARQVEKSLIVDDGIRGGSKAIPIFERARAPVTLEANERNPLMNANDFQPLHHVGKSGGAESQSAVHSELSERRKLKILPRSKPLETQELPLEYKPQPTVPLHVEINNRSHEMQIPLKAGLVGSESGNPLVERPKLNLKPRSEPLDPAEDGTESKRNTLFGGARPRELVLKERGIDNVAVHDDDLALSPQRVKQDVLKTDRVSVHAASTRYNDKPGSIPIEHRTGKNSDGRDHRLEVEKTDVQKRNWRGENWRNKREFEKQHPPHQHLQPQQQERPPSPETWRKPVEHPKAASADAPGLRYGKAASAVELAQAFSRSISDSPTPDRFSGQKGPPSQGQMPFSRLTGPTPRPQINGY